MYVIRNVLMIGLVLFSAGVKSVEIVDEEVTFDSRGAVLSGTLVLPVIDDIEAAVVFVHGSGKQMRDLGLANRLAELGIATLVYDKRGVGKSGGVYESKQSVSEQNIVLLADDAASALRRLAKHPLLDDAKLGLTGISQAGWIVPIAAHKTDLADFMVLWSGPVCKVSEEDIYSKHTRDNDNEKVPSYQEALNARTSRYHWPDFLGKDSNPSDSLANINIPGLWVYGERDGSIPVDLSIQRLEELISKGKNYQHVTFADLGHNNIPETIVTVEQWIKQLLN